MHCESRRGSVIAVHFRRIALVSSFQTSPLFRCISFQKRNLSLKHSMCFSAHGEFACLCVSIAFQQNMKRITQLQPLWTLLA